VISTELTLVLPCDMPFLPDDLLVHLRTGRGAAHACGVFDGEHHHYLVLLLETVCLQSAGRALGSADHSVRSWLAQLNPVWIDCSDNREAFANVNSTLDLNQFNHAHSRLS